MNSIFLRIQNQRKSIRGWKPTHLTSINGHLFLLPHGTMLMAKYANYAKYVCPQGKYRCWMGWFPPTQKVLDKLTFGNVQRS